MKTIDENFIKRQWEDVIEKVDKYFGSPIKEDPMVPEAVTRSFVYSNKKRWMDKVLCNLYITRNLYDSKFDRPVRINILDARLRCGSFEYNDTTYFVNVKPLSYGNTRVTLRVYTTR